MNEMYGSNVTVGQMLSVYMDQRQQVRKEMKVLHIPSLVEIRRLFQFGSLFAYTNA